MMGQQLPEPEGRGGRGKGGAGSGEGRRRAARRREGRIRVSDRGLHGPAEALLIHARVELTGERTTPPLMMAAKVGVGGGVIWPVWREPLCCLMGEEGGGGQKWTEPRTVMESTLAARWVYVFC